MYSKRFQLWSKLGVYAAVVVLVAVTLFGSIAPASPTLENTKRKIENENRWIGMCGLEIISRMREKDAKP